MAYPQGHICTWTGKRTLARTCSSSGTQKPSVLFNDDKSDSHEGHGQQEWDNIDCDLTFEASFSSSEMHLLKN